MFICDYSINIGMDFGKVSCLTVRLHAWKVLNGEVYKNNGGQIDLKFVVIFKTVGP